MWLESGQRGERVVTSPGAFRFLARPMQIMSIETPHQSRKNLLEACSSVLSNVSQQGQTMLKPSSYFTERTVSPRSQR